MGKTSDKERKNFGQNDDKYRTKRQTLTQRRKNIPQSEGKHLTKKGKVSMRENPRKKRKIVKAKQGDFCQRGQILDKRANIFTKRVNPRH